MATKFSPAMLAPRQNIPRPVDRFADRREEAELQQLEQRLRAELASVLRDARCRPEPRTAWDDNSRAEPRSRHASLKERLMIRGAARAEATTAERVLDYHLTLIEIDLAAFTEPVHVAEMLLIRLAREQAEAMAGQSLAYAIPSRANRERAAQLTELALRSGRVFCQLARQGHVLWPREATC